MTRTALTTCAAFTALALAAGCSEHELSTLDDNYGANGPVIMVDPEFIDFGELQRDEVVTQTFSVTNIGEETLEVSNVGLGSGQTGFTILSTELSFDLQPAEEMLIDVAYTPFGMLEENKVIIDSNDEDTPKAIVELMGAGLVPELAIEPDPYDYGSTYVGCARDHDFTITSVGNDAVTIDSISGGDELNYFFSNANALPVTLQPGEALSVSMAFDPWDDTASSSGITVTSDEPLGTRTGTQTGEGEYTYIYTDEFELPENPPSDIMVLTDQSCSMDDNNRQLGDNFDYFIESLSGFTTDWQVMVVNDDNGCSNSGILTRSTSGYKNTFKNAVQSGGGYYTEALLTVADEATNKSRTGCNAGFMRDDAMLHILMVSDEPEQSSGSWSTLVNSIINAKGSASLVKLSAIVGDYPGGCSSSAGSADAGTGYYEAVNYTGGEFLSICATNWESYMPLLAEASVSQATFELSATPVEHSITVKVNGTERSGGWHYDSGTNSVIFDSDVPADGDQVRITYAGLANCD